MAMDKDDVIDTLNHLIETCKDGEQGFMTCAEDIKNFPVKEKDLPPNIRSIVERQYRGVLENHDRVRALEKAAKAAS